MGKLWSDLDLSSRRQQFEMGIGVLGQLATFASQDHCPKDNSPPGQPHTRTTTNHENTHRDQYVCGEELSWWGVVLAEICRSGELSGYSK